MLLCAPWRRDGHPDHEAVGRAAAVAAARTDARLVEYPVWLWHWGGEHDLPWDQALRLPLDAAALAAKRRAISAHASQVQPLSTEPGDEVLLGGDLLAHFDRDAEVFIATDEPVEDDALDRVHRERPDPWQVDSPYERRKRALTLASLPREHYGRILEVGCSVGALAVDLAQPLRPARWRSTTAGRRSTWPARAPPGWTTSTSVGSGSPTSGRRDASTWCRSRRSATS